MESFNAKPKSVQWFEPKWSYRPRLKTELCQILNLKMWLRIASVVVLLTVALAFVIKRTVPDLEFNWIAALAKGIGGLAIGMTGMATVLWFFSPTIKIWNKGIMRQQGSSHHMLLLSDIRQISVDATNPSQQWLRVETVKKPFECGIADKISPTDLAQWLRESFPEIHVSEKL